MGQAGFRRRVRLRTRGRWPRLGLAYAVACLGRSTIVERPVRKKGVSMRFIRPALIALFAAVWMAAAAPAAAVAFSIDQSDLWYIPAESGWGMQLVQRNSTIFATLFVYDPAGNPIWYVATMNPIAPSEWSGDLYATTGPWFGTVPFNPASVTVTKVGTMSWTLGSFDDEGTVNYTVSGVSVSKNVIREPLVTEDYSGHFYGVIHQS